MQKGAILHDKQIMPLCFSIRATFSFLLGTWRGIARNYYIVIVVVEAACIVSMTEVDLQPRIYVYTGSLPYWSIHEIILTCILNSSVVLATMVVQNGSFNLKNHVNSRD